MKITLGKVDMSVNWTNIIKLLISNLHLYTALNQGVSLVSLLLLLVYNWNNVKHELIP